jgi:hypothetical protein
MNYRAFKKKWRKLNKKGIKANELNTISLIQECWPANGITRGYGISTMGQPILGERAYQFYLGYDYKYEVSYMRVVHPNRSLHSTLILDYFTLPALRFVLLTILKYMDQNKCLK